VPGKRGGLCRLRDTRGGEHPPHTGVSLLGHPLCADPARAGGGVHGRDARASDRPRGGSLGDPGTGRDQHAARCRRRHHQQHSHGRDLCAGRPRSRVQGVASVRRPGVDVRPDHPLGRRRAHRARDTGDGSQGLQTRRDRTAGRGVSSRARALGRRPRRLRPDTVAAQRRSRRGAGGGPGGARGRHPARRAAAGGAGRPRRLRAATPRRR